MFAVSLIQPMQKVTLVLAARARAVLITHLFAPPRVVPVAMCSPSLIRDRERLDYLGVTQHVGFRVRRPVFAQYFANTRSLYSSEKLTASSSMRPSAPAASVKSAASSIIHRRRPPFFMKRATTRNLAVQQYAATRIDAAGLRHDGAYALDSVLRVKSRFYKTGGETRMNIGVPSETTSKTGCR